MGEVGPVSFNTIQNTVNSEIFVRVLFLRNFAGAKFHENKTFAKWQNLSFGYCMM